MATAFMSLSGAAFADSGSLNSQSVLASAPEHVLTIASHETEDGSAAIILATVIDTDGTFETGDLVALANTELPGEKTGIMMLAEAGSTEPMPLIVPHAVMLADLPSADKMILAGFDLETLHGRHSDHGVRFAGGKKLRMTHLVG